MLVLSRKKDEMICIGPNTYITVVAIQGGRVSLGIEAPRDVTIHRAKLQQRANADEKNVSTHANYVPIA